MAGGRVFEETCRVATIESIVSRKRLGGRSAEYRVVRGIHQNQTVSIYTFYNSVQRRRLRSDTCFHSNKLGSSIIISIRCIAPRALHKRALITYSIGVLHSTDYFQEFAERFLLIVTAFRCIFGSRFLFFFFIFLTFDGSSFSKDLQTFEINLLHFHF